MTRARPVPCGDLLDFNEVQLRLQLGPRSDIGTREIPIAQVIGSVGRVHEFDACFRPRTKSLRERLRQIRMVRPDAADVPILVYQVDHAYFVVDGHKRLALATEDGREYIDAEVGWFPSRFHVARGTTMDQIRATQFERRFREVTGLAVAVPEARFPLTDPDAFLELAESVKSHAYDLSRLRGVIVDPATAARHWYEHVYAPAVALAKESRLHWVLSSCTEPELFLVLRRGAHEGMGSAWEMPQAFVERGLQNLRGAEPSPIPAALARLTRRPRRKGALLPDADVGRISPQLGTSPDDDEATILRRPKRQA
jgi:hypothetical protein